MIGQGSGLSGCLFDSNEWVRSESFYGGKYPLHKGWKVMLYLFAHCCILFLILDLFFRY